MVRSEVARGDATKPVSTGQVTKFKHTAAAVGACSNGMSLEFLSISTHPAPM